MKKITLLIGVLTFTLFSFAGQSIVFKGKITNSNYEGIPNVTIQILNTNLIAKTNNEGTFLFQNLPNNEYVIKITALGYTTLIERLIVQYQTENEIIFKLTESGNELDEIIVTAQKQDERQQNVPLSITAINIKNIREYKLWDIKDITAIVPNLYSANPGDNRNITSIRGITSTSYDPAVAVYIDGVNQFGLDTYISQLQDVEQIEVLSGPQGTLYGRNAMGGVINITTKQPNQNFTGFAELGISNFNQQRYNAGIKLPILRDKLFFAASGLYNKRDGYYTNTFNNSNFDRQNSSMGNYTLKFIPNTKLVLNFNAKHVTNSNNGAFPLASSINDALENPYMLNQNSLANMSDRTFNTSLSLNYNANKFNLIAQTAYQSNYRFYKSPIDGDFSPFDGYAIINNYGKDWNNVNVISQELRLSSSATSKSKLKWIAGTYLFYQYNPVKQGIHIGSDGNLLGAPESNVTYINTNIGSGKGLALFGQGTFHLNQKLELSFGLRYDLENRKLSAKGERQPDGNNIGTIFPETLASGNFNAFSPKLGLNHKINQNSTLFLTYNRGFRTGGISQLSGDPREALLTYEPELSDNFEIGSKNIFFDNRLRLNTAVFYTNVNNAQVPSLLLPDAITVTRNVGKLKNKGFELQLDFIPIKDLEVNYNFGYADAKYKQLDLPNNGASQTFKNNKQVFTPNITSMLASQYNHQLKKNKFFARFEWRYLGKQFFDLSNQLEQKAYYLINTRVGINFKKVDLTLYAENLFNKTYVDYAYNFGAAHLGTPRTYGILLRSNF